MAAGYCAQVRLPPQLYSPPLSFETQFVDRVQALEFFDEGWGAVTTAGSLACRRTDHLRYDQSFDGYGVDARGRRGLRILMDDKNGSSCHRDSQTATGHLLTKQYMPASGGRIEMLARVGFGTDPSIAYRSADSFSCLGLYVHDSVSEFGYRNEISMCVSSADTKTVRMGYWVGDDGDKQHAKQATLPVDLAQGFHLYSIDWSLTKISIAIDNEPIWVVDGKAMCAGGRAAEVDASGAVTRLPFEPMSVRIILRPRGREYFSPTYMDVASFAYTPTAGAAVAAAVDAAAGSASDAAPITAGEHEQVQEKTEEDADAAVEDSGVLEAADAQPQPKQHAAVPATEVVGTTTVPPLPSPPQAGIVDAAEPASMSSAAAAQGAKRRPSYLVLAFVWVAAILKQLTT